MWASRALRTGVVGFILTLAAAGLALGSSQNAGALVAGASLPLVLVVLGLGLRELDGDALDGARRRGALLGLVLAAITLLAALAFLHSLGVEVPWRFWRLAHPMQG
jgi:predicted permease